MGEPQCPRLQKFNLMTVPPPLAPSVRAARRASAGDRDRTLPRSARQVRTSPTKEQAWNQVRVPGSNHECRFKPRVFMTLEGASIY
eukprot:610412-Hanusia_phi.AAC.1